MANIDSSHTAKLLLINTQVRERKARESAKAFLVLQAVINVYKKHYGWAKNGLTAKQIIQLDDGDYIEGMTPKMVGRILNNIDFRIALKEAGYLFYIWSRANNRTRYMCEPK